VRILHIANGRLYGGVERMLATLAESRALLRRVTFEFAVCHEGRLDRELRSREVEVHALGNVRISRPTTILHARRQLRALLATGRYGAVVCHAPWTHALFGTIATRGNLPLVLWQHDRADGRTLVERAVTRIPAALVICNSQWTAASADRLQPGVPRRVVYCPVGAPRLRSSRASVRATLGAIDSDVVILAASRLEPWKGHLQLIDALARVPVRRWVLWIAGGPQRPQESHYLGEVQGAARACGIAGRVRFLGERDDVPDLLAAADILAQPNVEPEPFGIVFAEALRSGLPVVTTRMGGATEIVAESCGRLVPPRDPAALSGALAELIGDGSLRAMLGAAGPSHAAATCDPAIVLPVLEEALVAAGARAAA
jgi:glycosyltransferase involved in cell wall biosynthesis